MKKLKSKGVRLAFIAKVLKHGEEISRSTTYYHLSDNRKAYEYRPRKARERQQEVIAERLTELVNSGLSTGDIARNWGIPLKVINKIYTKA